MDINDARYAYHEAGHAVAAAALGYAFRSSGIHIDACGNGVTHIVCPSRRCSSPFTTLQLSQTRMVIILFAGALAQKLFFPDSTKNSAADDNTKIEQYLCAIYRTDEAAKSIARQYFEMEAKRLVNAFEEVIRKLGDSLWSRDWTPRVEDWGSGLSVEKTIDAATIGEILKDRNILCKVDDSTQATETDLVD